MNVPTYFPLRFNGFRFFNRTRSTLDLFRRRGNCLLCCGGCCDLFSLCLTFYTSLSLTHSFNRRGRDLNLAYSFDGRGGNLGLTLSFNWYGRSLGSTSSFSLRSRGGTSLALFLSCLWIAPLHHVAEDYFRNPKCTFDFSHGLRSQDHINE